MKTKLTVFMSAFLLIFVGVLASAPAQAEDENSGSMMGQMGSESGMMNQGNTMMGNSGNMMGQGMGQGQQMKDKAGTMMDQGNQMMNKSGSMMGQGMGQGKQMMGNAGNMMGQGMSQGKQMMDNSGNMMGKAHIATEKEVATLSAAGNKICPVSGEKVKDEAVQMAYNGKIYNLCCPLCVKDFTKDPEKYITIINNQSGTAAPVKDADGDQDGD